MVKGRYARLSHPSKRATPAFRLGEMEFYGFRDTLNIHRYLNIFYFPKVSRN